MRLKYAESSPKITQIQIRPNFDQIKFNLNFFWLEKNKNGSYIVVIDKGRKEDPGE